MCFVSCDVIMLQDVDKRLQKGFDAVLLTMKSVVEKRAKWKYFSIVLYDEGAVESEKWIVIPEFFLLSLALTLCKRGEKTILLLDSTYEHPYSISAIPQWYRNLFSHLKCDKFLYFFGSDLAGIREVLNAPHLKLDLKSVLESEYFKAALLANLPVSRKLDEEKFTRIKNIEYLSDFIIDFMRPPTLKEELKKELSKVSVEKVGGHVISSLTLIFNPGAAAGKGLSYAFKFMRVVSKMESEEYKEFAKKWKENIENSFNPNMLSQLIGENVLEEAKKKLEQGCFLIIVTDIFKNLQNMFIPILLKNLVTDVGKVTLLMDSITFMDRYDFFLQWLTNKIESNEISLVAITPTMGAFSEKFDSFFEKLISERIMLFDLSSKFMDILFKGKPATEEAWVLKHLYQVKQLQDKGDVAFVSFDSNSPIKWKFVRPSLMAKIKKKIFGIKI